MKAQFVVLAFLVALLTACSKGPFTADAKAAFQSHIGDGCSRLAIKDFEKVDAVAQGDTEYQVSVKYLLEIKPPQGNDLTQEEFDSKAKAIQQQMEQTQQEMTDIRKVESELASTPNRDQTAIAETYHKEDDISSRMQAASRAWRDLLAEPSDTFLHECPHLDSGWYMELSSDAHHYEQDNPGKNAFLNGFSLDMTQTISLIKTDNGWKENL